MPETSPELFHYFSNNPKKEILCIITYKWEKWGSDGEMTCLDHMVVMGGDFEGEGLGSPMVIYCWV